MKKPRKKFVSMSSYSNLCDLVDVAEPKVESITNPTQDDVQDAWLKTISALKRRGETIDNAQTQQELRELFSKDSGIVVQNYKNAIVDRLRRDQGSATSPNKQAIIAMFASIDEATANDEGWIHLIEDHQAQVAFRSIEDMSEIVSLLERLPPDHRKIIKRFIYAWALQEAGYEIPRSVSRRISRDRKKINLPLVLKQGKRN